MKKLLTLLSLIIVLFTVIMPAMAYGKAVISNVVIDEAGRMIMVEASRGESLPKPDISRMVKPNRLIIDIPGSALGTSPKLVKVNNNNISLMRVIEVDVHGKHTVRIIVESEEDKIIERVKITESPGSMFLQLDNLPSSGSNDLLDDSKQVKITKIDYRDEQILIAGTGPIKVKPPIILKNPTRMVIDIPNAKVTDKKLLAPILVGEGEVDVVRIGQFDDNTVRIVIETDTPHRLYPVYGENQESVVITSNPSFATNNLPRDVSLGYIKSIKVVKDKGIGTILRIEASMPLVHKVRRIHEPEKVIVDLINAEPPRTDVTSALETTDELLGVKIGHLMANNPNSRIVIDLAAAGVEARTNLSVDGKIMEIVLSQGESPMSFAATNGDLKVVIDAGHGGYEPGCTADGFKEKDITLDVAKRVRVLLEKAGVKVFMTRSTDSTLSLKERVEITNNVNPAAFISIHVNASKSSAPEGISTHWYTNQSIPLAKKIQNALVNKVGAVDRGIVKNMFYVVHHTQVPAVLVEIGFLTNSKERVDILTHERKQNTAQGIVQGVLQFLGTKK